MAILSPMRYKDYTWPHNPRVYEIAFERKMAVHKVPFGQYILQPMGRTMRVLRGEGEFVGPGAYDEFKKLATLFYEDTPGLLTHPVWQVSNAYFVRLRLRQEPTEDFVAYSFEFWESYDEYKRGATLLKAEEPELPYTAVPETQESWYTAVYGDCLWNIALAHGLTLQELLALNPQIKNPNLLYVGDRVRVA